MVIGNLNDAQRWKFRRNVLDLSLPKELVRLDQNWQVHILSSANSDQSTGLAEALGRGRL